MSVGSSRKISASHSDRVICYVDGFNLYYGLRDAGWKRYYWLNVHTLAESLLHPNQRIVATKYFTARRSGAWPGDTPQKAQEREASRLRQQVYLQALESWAGVHMYYGHYQLQSKRCRLCKASWLGAEEKMTDAFIASEMLADAFTNQFDVAFLISADGDLVPPVRTIRVMFSDKKVIACFPPKRTCEELKSTAHAYLRIGRGKFAKSQLPDMVTNLFGHDVQCPKEWR